MTKGLDNRLIDDYIDDNIEMLLEYEQKSARSLAIKKSSILTIDEINLYLINKGYKKSSIEYALEEL